MSSNITNKISSLTYTVESQTRRNFIRSRPCANCTCSPGLLNRQARGIAHSSLTQSQDKNISPPDIEDILADNSSDLNTSNRLKELRQVMKHYDLAAYIVPSEDEHASEYTSLADQRRCFISGFSGSSGVAVITRDLGGFNEEQDGAAVLSTDGRYFIQAQNELDFNWSLLRQGVPEDPKWENWLIEQVLIDIKSNINDEKIGKIGIDGKLISISSFLNFKKLINDYLKKIENKNYKIELINIEKNLIDLIWFKFENKPIRENNKVLIHDIKYSGLTFKDKLKNLREELININNKNKTSIDNYNNDIKKENENLIVLSSLDEIAWLLNLRGNDINYNPVFFSYCLITNSRVILYINPSKVSTDLCQNYLKKNNIEIKNYEEIWNDLKDLSTIIKKSKNKNISILVPKSSSWAINTSLEENKTLGKIKCNILIDNSPIEISKSIKNNVELNGSRKAHLRDGYALIHFYSWLEEHIIAGEIIDELTASKKLHEFRSKDFEAKYVGDSFETISSTGPNAAIIHYAPTKENCSIINVDDIYLNDSGGQYKCGTTDVTRTFHFGEPTNEEKKAYTLVLKGHLALSHASFPRGTTGMMLDPLAREYLLNDGKDYQHGTGHGVGSFLSVHEGPMGITSRPSAGGIPLQPGNILSVEPGYYLPGKFGIRIENLVAVIPKVNKKRKKGQEDATIGDELRFETLTLVPYCRKLIDLSMITPKERQWINSYHFRIWETYSKKLKNQSYAHQWLKRETRAL